MHIDWAAESMPPDAMQPLRLTRLARSASDLIGVVVAPLLVFALASWLELFERYAAWSQRYEHLDVDEVIFMLVALACALAWYAARRWREARRSQQALAAVLRDNRELARQLIGVQENERRALARELHDELGQTLTALRAETALLAPAGAARVGALADTLSSQVRGLLHQLRPAELDAQGLVAAIQALCEAWESRSGVACVFHHDDGADVLGEAVNVAVYRVVQEALSNVMQHAQASTVRVALHRQAGVDKVLRLSVRDDGVGMDEAAPRRGLGLLGAAERAAALGGHLRVESAPRRGLTLEVTLPLPARAP